MAEDGLLHTTELLRTALPYVDVKSRLTLELLVKLYELILCIRNYTTRNISSCSYQNEKIDMETLLNNIRPKCNEKERSFVDRMLNIFQAKRMFEMYNTYMEAMNAMEGFEGFGGNNNGNDSDENTDNIKDYDFSSIFGDNPNSDDIYDIATKNNDFSGESVDDNTSDYDNNSMFEELKAMIPPDQMETFENIRMLFGSMSYDDSNKPDENKEK
jgi:hypothetical protein